MGIHTTRSYFADEPENNTTTSQAIELQIVGSTDEFWRRKAKSQSVLREGSMRLSGFIRDARISARSLRMASGAVMARCMFRVSRASVKRCVIC